MILLHFVPHKYFPFNRFSQNFTYPYFQMPSRPRNPGFEDGKFVRSDYFTQGPGRVELVSPRVRPKVPPSFQTPWSPCGVRDKKVNGLSQSQSYPLVEETDLSINTQSVPDITTPSLISSLTEFVVTLNDQSQVPDDTTFPHHPEDSSRVPCDGVFLTSSTW